MILQTKGRPLMMQSVFESLVPLALGAVFIVLLLGLWNMIRGGSSSRSQTLMRWRVITQFVAICLVAATLYLMGR